MRLTTKYRTQTPFTVELVSDILFIISQATVGYSVFEGNMTLAWISIGTGTLAKILARFVEGKTNAEERLDDQFITPCNCTDGNCSCKSGAAE